MTEEKDVGSQAPDFELSAYDGRIIRLADYRDKSLVVLFFVREYN
jgi:peroxiredoxin